MYVVFIGIAWGVAVGGELGPGVSKLGVGASSHRFGPRSLAGTTLGFLIHLRSQSAVRLLPTWVRSAATLPPPLPRLWQFKHPFWSINCFSCAIFAVSWKPAYAGSGSSRPVAEAAFSRACPQSPYWMKAITFSIFSSLRGPPSEMPHGGIWTPGWFD